MDEGFKLVTTARQTLCFVCVLQTLPQKRLSHTLNGNRSLGSSFWKSRVKWTRNTHKKCYSKGKIKVRWSFHNKKKYISWHKLNCSVSHFNLLTFHNTWLSSGLWCCALILYMLMETKSCWIPIFSDRIKTQINSLPINSLWCETGATLQMSQGLYLIMQFIWTSGFYLVL